MREIVVRDHRIRLDLAPQVLQVECPEETSWNAEDLEPPLSATITPLRQGRFVSASVLAQKAKLFDDGLYAAVELAAQRGLGRFTGKEAMLLKLARRLAGLEGPRAGNPAAVLLAACELSGIGVGMPAGLASEVRELVAGFMGDDIRSKPLGFYTWAPELENIFRQDRMLQTELEGALGIEVLARALHGEPLLRAAYEQTLRLAERLTNPFVRPDLRPLLQGLDADAAVFPESGVSFLPPSESPEGALVKRLFGARPVPEGFNLADELIRRIRAGDLWLTPKDDSGWYDYTVWSLESLVAPERMPEAPRVEFGPRYRAQLVELFKGILALARETHVKQLEVPRAGCAPPMPKVTIVPELSAEPLPTHYHRRAMGYRLVGRILEETFGEVVLDDLRRLTPGGPAKLPLGRELMLMEALFNGAYVTAMRELGLTADPKLATGRTGGADADAARFAGWAADQSEDPDLYRDSRMMVPVFRDVGRGLTKVWAFLGWSARKVVVSFKKPPSVSISAAGLGKKSGPPPQIEFDAATYTLIYPVTTEVYVSRLLDRDEFRLHCDRWKTRKAIVENLA